MPLINHAKKEINAKIVYCGPASGGKATNLQFVYSKLKESTRGAFKSTSLQNDRMLFFDFMPSSQGNLNGYNIRFHIYTLTGAPSSPASWKMVLKGVDGLVFVADSRPDSLSATRASFRDLNTSLARYGKNLTEIPCVIQCNKQDVPQALSTEAIERELAPLDAQVFPAVAAKGDGVLETIFALIRLVLRNIRNAGIEMEEHHTEFQTSEVPPGNVVHPSAHAAVADKDMKTDSVASASESQSRSNVITVSAPVLDGIDEPLLEIAGNMEIIDGGNVQLPLSIKYGGKVKQVKLNISISSFVDSKAL